ncbi:MAG: hypothetical protein AAF125_08580, partial [Chloroflexota bacterium]
MRPTSYWIVSSILNAIIGLPIILQTSDVRSPAIFVVVVSALMAVIISVPNLMRILNLTRQRVWLLWVVVVGGGFTLWLWGIVAYQPSYAIAPTVVQWYFTIGAGYTLVALTLAHLDESTREVIRIRASS